MSREERHEILSGGLSVGIRLHSIEFPNGLTSATVTFELVSQGHPMGEKTRPLTMIRLAAPCSQQGAPAYKEVVAHAACKLKADFQEISDMLDRTYCDA